ncbi:MAG: hypothetical protein DMF98_17460 [Acidobacteria bacterium]|nr:MAG: hypothetical protein DMF98_17460 [Acidobacteriota bacterium]
MTGHTVEITMGGKAVKVPALDVNGQTFVVTGKWMKIAAIHDEDWIEEAHEDLESCISALKKHNANSLRADIFTVTQRLPDTTRRYPYHVEWESVAAIRLSSYEEWWTNRISADARKDIRRSAKRGVVVKVTDFDDDLVKGIVEIYNESPIRQGKAFWHYQKDFDTVKREKSTYLERSTFIGAYCNDELIGFMKIVSVGSVAAMMQILTKISHYDKRPSNALIAKAVEHCATAGMSWLTYGKYRDRNKGTSSLARFKHRMGFEEVRVPKFYVPLTIKGWTCLALGLHRDLVTMLPEWLIDLLYSVRTAWGRWRIRARRSSDSGREG